MAAMTTVIRAVIEADTKRLDAGLARAGDSLKKFGRSTAQAGKQMTAGVTLPLVGAGIGAFKTASDFETSMAKIQSLVGLSAETVKGFEKDVLNLAGETGRAPRELADAMFFITSAGLRGADAVEALTTSAKAAAAGLGETEGVADAVTNALNGYEAGSISAAHATDVLVKTVEQGKASAADLAPQFGRLVPMAAELGVGFDQVGAGLAFLTRSSGNASQSATALRGVLSKLVKPSQQGVKELDRIGMSMADLRKHVREKGLLSALDMLKRASVENGFAMAKYFEDVEALNGVLALTGPKADEARVVFDELTRSTGKLDEAFAVAADTTEVKMGRAAAGLKTLLIQLGASIIPVVVPMVQQLSSILSGLAERFRALNPLQRKMVMLLAGVAAAAGPVLLIVGGLISTLGALVKVASSVVGVGMKLAGLLFGLSAPVLVTVGVIAALAAGFVIAYQRSERFRNVVDSVRRWLVDSFWPVMRRVVENIVEAWQAVARFAETFLAPIVVAAFGAMMNVATTFMEFGRSVVSFFRHLVTGDWSDLWGDFKNVASAAVMLLVETFVTLPARIIAAMRPLIREVATFAGQVGWSLLASFMSFVADTLLPWVQSIPDQFVAAIGKFLHLVFAAGEHLGMELLAGFKDMLLDIGSVASTVVDFGERIVGWIVSGIKAAAGAIGDAIMGAVPSPGDVLGGLGDFLDGLNPFAAPAPEIRPGRKARTPKVSAPKVSAPAAAFAPVRLVSKPPVIPPRSRAGQFGFGGPPGTGLAPSITVNVQGSVVAERDLAETMRQVSLRSQQSGKVAVI